MRYSEAFMMKGNLGKMGVSSKIFHSDNGSNCTVVLTLRPDQKVEVLGTLPYKCDTKAMGKGMYLVKANPAWKMPRKFGSRIANKMKTIGE